MTLTKSECAKMGSPKSREISAKKRQLNIEKYFKNPKKCKQCNHLLTYEQRKNIFCSSSCAATFNNKGIRRHGNPRKLCLYCGEPVKSIGAVGFCCIRHGILYNLTHKLIENKKLSSKSIRQCLIQIRGYKCESCGIDKWQNKPVPLDLHHIDGDKLNNTTDNLILLCKNCHGITDSYAIGKNK